MIEQEILLKLAHEYADSYRREQKSLLAAYLCGSVARGEPPLGNATDLDVVLIDYAPDEGHKPYIRLSDEVVLDVRVTQPNEYRDKPALRRHHLAGPTLYNATSLYDPEHFFDLVQAAIRGQFDMPENTYARARSAYRQALEEFEAIARFREDPVPVPLYRDELHRLHATFEFGATALLMLSFRTHSCRRHMMQFETVTTQLKRPDLYTLALEGLGFKGLTKDQVAALRADWHNVFVAANRFHQGPWHEDQYVHALRRQYYLRGFETLAESGHAQNSMLIMEHTLAACANQILTHAPPEEAVPYLESYAAWLTHTQKGTSEAFAERVRLAAAFLAEVETLLVAWARDQGVPL